MIAILGLGLTGEMVYDYLDNFEEEIVIIDDNYQGDKFSVLRSEQVLADNLEFSYIVKSPGIKYSHPVLVKYRDIKIVNDIELFYQASLNSRVKIIGITGTNGKTSTVTLLNNVLNRSGFKSVSAGNIGISPLHYIDQLDIIDYVVLELSSFQLQGINEFKTYTPFFLNFTPDHLDYHASIDEYYEAKLNIIKNGSTSNKFYVGEQITEVDTNLELVHGIRLEIDYNKINMGIHPQNIALINSFLLNEGIDTKYLVDELYEGYKGIEHRVELVAEHNNVKFFNDSKATNVSASSFALSRLNNIILLVGGFDKNEDLSELNKYLGNVKEVIAYGENKAKFGFISDLIMVDNLEQAFDRAVIYASAGDVILLSPASASYDQFKNYSERGNYFKKLVEEHINEIHN